MNKKIFWLIGIVAVCFIGIMLLTNTSKEAVAINYEGQPFLGEATAPVDIIEFGDYKCPHCKDFNDNMLPIIYKEAVETGKAKLYFMNYSFIAPDSITAALFAETVYQELGNDVFWSFHDALFANQISSDGQMTVFTDELFEKMLGEIVSEEKTAKVMTAYHEEKGKAALEKDMEIAQKLNISSTPSIFINGVAFNGNTLNDFMEMVEEAKEHDQ